MKILHVVASMDRGGAEAATVEHVRCASHDIENWVCSLDGGGAALEQARRAGAGVLALSRGRQPFADRARAVYRLTALMKHERFAVVHGHDPSASIQATLAAVWAGVPVVVRSEHGIHYRGRNTGIPPQLDLVALRATRRILCTSEAVRRSHAVRAPWAGDRFVTVTAGVSAAIASRPRATFRAELGFLDRDRVVLAVAALTPRKALHVLVEAFHRITRRSSAARLVIAGDGPLRPDLERQVVDAGIADRVRFLGDRDDVPDLLEAADVFASTSAREGMSIALLESMRAGIPAVVSRVGGNPEAVVDGGTGWIVPAGDPGLTAEALLHLLEDRARARSFGAAARDRWARHFTADRMVRETEQIYRAELDAVRDAHARQAQPDAAGAWSDAPEGRP